MLRALKDVGLRPIDGKEFQLAIFRPFGEKNDTKIAVFRQYIIPTVLIKDCDCIIDLEYPIRAFYDQVSRKTN